MKNQKKDTKKNSNTQQVKKNDTAQSGNTSSAVTTWIIGLIVLFAGFMLFFLFLPSKSGWLGTSLNKLFCSTFSWGAYLIPFLLFIRVINWKKDASSKKPRLNWWLSLAFLCLFACFLASIKCDVEEVLNFKKHFNSAFAPDGSLTTNSLVGGVLANLFSKFIGNIFTTILCAVSLLVLAPLLVSKEPLSLLQFILRKLRDKFLKLKQNHEKHKERAKNTAVYEQEQISLKNSDLKENKKSRKEKIDFSEISDEKSDEEEDAEALENTDLENDDDITDTQVSEIQTAEKTKLEQIFSTPHETSEIHKEENLSEDENSSEEALFEEKQELDFNDETEEGREYKYPPIEFLKRGEGISSAMEQEYEATAKKLVETLSSFNVRTKIINIAKGPTVTRYELQPETGVRVRNIRNLSDDIALSLASKGVRIEAPIPGKEAVGIEVPNKNTSVVNIRELIETKFFTDAKSRLTSCLGVDVAGNPVYCDIAKMPHILIAGTTGSGKSVCINSLLVSILYKSTPDEVKFILIDPKKIELSVYNGIPHLLVPVVSDPKKAAGALAWAVGEMERRFALIEEVGVRDIRSYNEVAKVETEREMLPRIVIVIDELADLMMMAKDNVEASICRIAQKARAAGMHLVIGTQRPSVDVITGLIKANVPSRIAFTVASQVDSKTILDMAGAEKLVGRGDMLYAPIGAMTPTRVQGAFVSDGEIEEITNFLKGNSESTYSDEAIEGIEREAERCVEKGRAKTGFADEDDEDNSELSLSSDPMLKPAIEIALDSGTISTSMLQRRLKLGYARAARIIDKMEALGVVSEFAGSKPRTVLISRERYLEMLTNSEE